MKKLSIILLTGILFACSSSNKYEKAIADFVQTDKKGTFYDMKFKALEIKELQRITVADSLSIYNDIKNQITLLQDTLREEKRTAYEFPDVKSMQDHTIWLLSVRGKLADLEASLPKNIYDNRPKDEVLAIVVQCKYSLVPPTLNTTITETKNFVLSPDGKRCFRKSKVE